MAPGSDVSCSSEELDCDKQVSIVEIRRKLWNLPRPGATSIRAVEIKVVRGAQNIAALRMLLAPDRQAFIQLSRVAKLLEERIPYLATFLASSEGRCIPNDDQTITSSRQEHI